MRRPFRIRRPRWVRSKPAAEKLGKIDFTSIWAGQAVRLGRDIPAAELTRALANDALARMRRLAG